MRQSWWLFIWSILLWPVGVVVGQDCPSVVAARDSIIAAADGGSAVISSIRENCQGAPDSLSRLYHALSLAAYYDPSDLPAAIEWAEKALEVQRKLYAEAPEEPLGKSLANLGFFYRKSGAYTSALPYLSEAEVVFTKLGNWRRRHNNRENMVYLWHATGDLGRAGELLPRMLAEARQQEPGYNRTIAVAETLRLLGVQADESENHAAALPYLLEASPLFAETNDVMSQIGTDMDIARTLYLTKDYNGARQKAQEVLAFIAPYDMPYEKAVLYNLLSLIYTDQGKFARAAEMLEPGLEQALLMGNPRVVALLYNSSSELAMARKDFPAAQRANIRAIGELTTGWTYSEESPLPSPPQLAASEFKVDLFKYISHHAKVLAEGGEDAGAREAVEAGDVTADYLRSDFSGEVSKLFWRKEAMPLYELGISLAAAAGDEETLLYHLEKSRSVLLLEALLEADLLGQMDPDLGTELSALEAGSRAGGELSVAGKDSLIALRGRIADQYPATRELIARPEMVSLSEARENLAAGGWDRQIHFFTGAERTYAFSITDEEVKTEDLGPSTDIAPAVRALMSFFTGPEAIDKDPEGFLAASYKVYRLLLEPLEIGAGEKLLVLPDGLLAYLPFNALVTAAGAAELGSAPYLIRRNQVSYAQSATVLDRQMTVGEDGAHENLAFAPFVTALPNNTAPALTFSKIELEGLQRWYAANLLEGPGANRSAFLEMSGGPSLLHLSTHAYATAEANEPPRILTADAPVYPADVYGLHLNADLVTLSACHSNIGPLAVGEGVLGLGRAFTAAGARGVVASLWSLNDRATADIVTDFYRQLGNGATKPQALHQAQLDYLERKDLPGYLKSPYYWAGLTYYGDGAGLPSGGWPWWAWLLAGCGIVLAVVAMIRWRR
ncbi:CHAT domain-containing protein [Neolewinella aurantiaca]|uniref:CHAT domain-containing protein n=1 Tax=Neolewinella aurantiaca TaxID=2602767 RepID=A0A5C7FMX1_9BACT|nr:CHAT domain-containing protein [Neolewinella aurantiaca]TXF91484.1 CHAT domain-containing protein [Neolewinella aurantiaca]